MQGGGILQTPISDSPCDVTAPSPHPGHTPDPTPARPHGGTGQNVKWPESQGRRTTPRSIHGKSLQTLKEKFSM